MSIMTRIYYFSTQTQNYTMALETSDLMMLKGLEKEGMTPYEQYMVGYKQSKKPSGVAIAGLTVASVAAAAAITSWIFSPLYGSAKANQAKEAAQSAKEVAMAYINGVDKRIDNISQLLEAEVTRRISGDQTITQTITDTISGQQSSQLTANQQAELAASQVATQQVMTGLMTGRYSENPQRVALYQDARPCPCPAGGCGCNG